LSLITNTKHRTFKGILPKVAVGPPISPHQLQALNKTDSILYIIQINTVQNPKLIFPTLLEDLQQVMRQFADVFAPPSELPPSRVGDHKIPLIEGAQPFCLRPFHYNPAQKLRFRVRLEICLIKVGFNPVLVHTHLQSYWCARKQVTSVCVWILDALMPSQ
jgi:hypothetical protein